jgi:hypothetical protein
MAKAGIVLSSGRRTAEFGITVEALAATIQHDLNHAPLYRDARGNEWNGLGDIPDWLRAAVDTERMGHQPLSPKSRFLVSRISCCRTSDSK